MKSTFKNKYIKSASRKWQIRFVFILCCANLIYVLPAKSDPLEELIKQCSMCHGSDGNSIAPVNPSIAGMPNEYFKHTLDAYKNNGRQSDMMKMFVHALTDAQVSGLAEFYEKQKYKPREQEFNKNKAAKGKELHDEYCEKCHEDAGRITVNNYGFLAGQWTVYLKKSIQDYLDKKRNAPPMMIIKLKKMKEANGEESIDLLMHYYASLQ
ncbi:MAG: c-type cytochrome [Gammaproteobacteria bacterium]|nr:c-type cytochrome [Gammaproteobacteria bacterium]